MCHPFREIQAITEIGGWQVRVLPWCLMSKMDSGDRVKLSYEGDTSKTGRRALGPF